MRRSPRVVLAWAIAAIVALGTARVVAGDLAALHRRARNLGADVHVVLAARDLALGTSISASDVRVVVRPASTVASDTLRDIGVAVGRIVAVPLLRDDAVRARALVAADRSGLDGLVPPGRRAVHVVVKDGFRPPVGAVVDVLATLDPASGASPTGGVDDTAALVAAGARVLAVDDESATSSEAGSGLTLLVTENEARAVAFAAGTGQIAIAIAPLETAAPP